ncbi:MULTISPECIES: HAD family acid phosphatase [Streptomyces]|uniref:Hydrolase n=1 Tax=Streptomyces virginiae TaxID=1961 RepID=A0ABQ3NYS9_STRVG|nr:MULTISPECIES: HAD family acid phosphatase [Streptomyces]KOU15780.1 hydrolase [Streptomyces sp. WM6349]KOU83491.1 hydrolase [Streptomyces sp. XY593]KOV42439.1 hydrolase [Streptomyces sp. H036]MBP2343552.1 putative secreted acid phosphatase [Streptomyces virginiae]MCI4080954.1 hydrolase [Streptomyces sp. MMS21 TC-5]
MRSSRRIRTPRTAVVGVAAAAAVLTLVPATAAQAAPAAAPAAVSAPATTTASSSATASAPGGNAAILGIDYATWQREVAAVVDAARPAIEQRIANAPAGEKPALVLDIDNTSLETDFHWFWTYPTPAIAKVRALTQYAHARGVAVFFVTARPGIIHSLTEYNLKAVGYPVSGLYVRDLPDLFEEVSTYKTAKRAEIEARGYTIIANIGNSPTDLVGGHAERTVKLPDYNGKLS